MFFEPTIYPQFQETLVDDRANQSRIWTEKNWTITARFSEKPCEPQCDRSKMQKVTREDNSHYHVCVNCNTIYETSKNT